LLSGPHQQPDEEHARGEDDHNRDHGLEPQPHAAFVLTEAVPWIGWSGSGASGPEMAPQTE
jgi:hypothetical protein